jgi:hypothetical protein
MTQAVDQTMLVELMTAGLQPELIARVANACAAAYARGLIDGTPQRSRGAERQARYRERHAVTSSPGVTLHDAASLNAQTSRGDASLSPAPSISKDKKDSFISERKGNRGTRIPDDWMPNVLEAKAEGLTDIDIEREAARFRDYWKSRAGSAAVKLDWSATWRNWCRNTAEKFGRPRPNASTPCAKRMVFVSAEDPAFAAWERQTGRRLPKNKNNGWYFDSHWPPGVQRGEVGTGSPSGCATTKTIQGEEES